MKLVILTAADVEQFKKALPTAKLTPPVLHHEELTADGVAIGLVRPVASVDARTNTYSIGFSRGDSDFVFIVRPTVHEFPSITLNIIRRAADERGAAEFASYTVLKDTVTTLKGQVAGIPKGQTGGITSETTPGGFDLAALLKYLKVQ